MKENFLNIDHCNPTIAYVRKKMRESGKPFTIFSNLMKVNQTFQNEAELDAAILEQNRDSGLLPIEETDLIELLF